jgi:ABC-type antimicrobial peptide transport system permease subunit
MDNPKLFIEVRTMRDEIDRMIAKEPMVAAISACFSLLGLLIASVGIFGGASCSVAQRTSEIGIRIALGADRWSVIRAALRDTTLVVAVGLAAGLIVAIAAVEITASSMSDLLFGLTATNPATFAAAGGLLLVVALAACILPARRATRIDLLTAIREE